MSMTPQPPRAPAPPQPARTGSHIVAIALLVLALIVVVSALTLWIGLRFLAKGVQVSVEEGARGQKEVSIKTPVGSLEVAKEVSEARLGLPVYPGAERLKDKDSASVNIGILGEENVGLWVAKYETDDSLGKVRDFYKQRLGSSVTKFTEKDPKGNTAFEIKHGDDEKVVALESRGGRTLIVLVHVTHSREGAN